MPVPNFPCFLITFPLGNEKEERKQAAEIGMFGLFPSGSFFPREESSEFAFASKIDTVPVDRTLTEQKFPKRENHVRRLLSPGDTVLTESRRSL